jgi:RNA-directed DNA polymerase
VTTTGTPGVDGITVSAYGVHLEANIEALVEKLKHKRYHARLVKRCYIPKGNGKQRPLGLPVMEDKLLQRAVSRLLNAIYEEDFLDFSNGYRPQRSAKDTVSDLVFNLQYGKYGYIVEADIQGFFDNLDRDKLLTMLKQRIDDRPFLGLIEKWLKAGILETDGAIVHPETGSPQGEVVSPILADIDLHHLLDL